MSVYLQFFCRFLLAKTTCFRRFFLKGPAEAFHHHQRGHQQRQVQSSDESLRQLAFPTFNRLFRLPNTRTSLRSVKMFGISYGELFLLIGATAALIGTKDLPIIARTVGRLAGRAIGYVQLARGQFENVMQQSQARQVHKELQDTMAQLEAIRYEIRSFSLMNPGPLTRKLMDNPLETSSPIDSGNVMFETVEEVEKLSVKTMIKDKNSLKTSESNNLHSQATAYAKLAESEAVKTGSFKAKLEKEKLDDQVGLFTILPVSAESTGMLPNRKENVTGSDVVLEAVLEAEVAHNAKDFFSQPQNQIPENP